MHHKTISTHPSLDYLAVILSTLLNVEHITASANENSSDTKVLLSLLELLNLNVNSESPFNRLIVLQRSEEVPLRIFIDKQTSVNRSDILNCLIEAGLNSSSDHPYIDLISPLLEFQSVRSTIQLFHEIKIITYRTVQEAIRSATDDQPHLWVPLSSFSDMDKGPEMLAHLKKGFTEVLNNTKGFSPLLVVCAPIDLECMLDHNPSPVDHLNECNHIVYVLLQKDDNRKGPINISLNYLLPLISTLSWYSLGPLKIMFPQLNLELNPSTKNSE